MKFQSFLKYFDWLEAQVAAQQATNTSNITNTTNTTTITNSINCVVGSTTAPSDSNTPTATPIDGVQVSRKVFSGKQWLTIEDWLECTIPLCPMEIRHESRVERSPDDIVQTVFASSRIGGDFLSSGWSQVSIII